MESTVEIVAIIVSCCGNESNPIKVPVILIKTQIKSLTTSIKKFSSIFSLLFIANIKIYRLNKKNVFFNLYEITTKKFLFYKTFPFFLLKINNWFSQSFDCSPYSSIATARMLSCLCTQSNPLIQKQPFFVCMFFCGCSNCSP